MDLLLSIIPSAIRLTLPLLYGAFGVLICAKAGIIYLGMEGALLGAGFVACGISQHTGSAMLGLLGACIFGVIYSLLFGFFALKCRGNHVVCSIGFNYIALGGTTFLMKPVFGNTGFSPSVTKLPLFHLPILGEQSIGFFIMLLCIFLVWFFIRKTNWGVRVCAIGENPGAADSLGININKYRIQVLVICGILAGIGGAELVLGQVGFFSRNITASKGYLSYSAVIFGGYNPMLVVLTSFLLGFFDAFQMRVQLLVNIPAEFLLIIPYLVTVIALTIFGKMNGPAMLGKDYVKGM